MVKRFVFDNLVIGKQVSIISDENGSKLVMITGAKQPVVELVQLKGKDQTPETLEIDLTTLIDIKGMKAMGNRLSQHPVKSVELIAAQEEEIADEKASADFKDDDTDDADGNGSADVGNDDADDSDGDVEAGNDEPNDKPLPPAPAESPKEKPAEPVSQPAQSPPKKIDFEITNPDDIDIDDKGQLGLF